MKVKIILKKWMKGIGWVDRPITFHKVPQEWQSSNGDLVIELKEVEK